jgi:hypothetical protein
MSKQSVLVPLGPREQTALMAEFISPELYLLAQYGDALDTFFESLKAENGDREVRGIPPLNERLNQTKEIVLAAVAETVRMGGR